MMDSVIHSAVMAGIFKGLPAVRVSLIAFDTAVVDLTEHADDPDRGTDERPARRRDQYRRRGGLLRDAGAISHADDRCACDRFLRGWAAGLACPLRSSGCARPGVRVLGLAALDADANPTYDHQMAERCVAAGAEVAALTPRRLAEWMTRVLS